MRGSVERTGIKRRHIASEGETTSDLALEAANARSSIADMTAADLDLDRGGHDHA
jgi:3-oxoacyl-[acyl-carrier-protein] synthase-3